MSENAELGRESLRSPPRYTLLPPSPCTRLRITLTTDSVEGYPPSLALPTAQRDPESARRLPPARAGSLVTVRALDQWPRPGKSVRVETAPDVWAKLLAMPGTSTFLVSPLGGGSSGAATLKTRVIVQPPEPQCGLREPREPQ